MTRGLAWIAGFFLCGLGLGGRTMLSAGEQAPGAASASPAPAPAANLSPAPVLQLHFEQAEVGATVLYRVGPPASPGVLSREPYQIRYELLRLTAHQATLARTTLTMAGREIAREVFSVERHARYPRASAPTAPAPSAATVAPAAPDLPTTCTVAGQTLNCRRILHTWKENGRSRTREWLLSPAVPLTGLVSAALDGVSQLELLAFTTGGPAEAAALSAATAVAIQSVQADQAAPTTAPHRHALADLPPGTLLVDPRAKSITRIPETPAPASPPPPADSAPAPAGDIEQELPPAP